MKLSDLQTKLIAAARTIPADDRVPYAFDKRIMARLASAVLPDPWIAWGRALWGGAITCVAVMALCGIYSFVTPHQNSGDSFSDEFETAVFASADADEAW